MSDLSLEQAYEVLSALKELHKSTAKLLDERGHQPARESPADTELRTFQRPELVLAAYCQADMLVEATADYVQAFIKLATPPVQTIATWSAVRGAIEAGAFATWLLDVGIDARTRVQRSLALLYKGFVEQAKLERDNKNTTVMKKISDKEVETESVALELGFPKIRNCKGKRIGIGQCPPTIVDVVDKALNVKTEYRYLSGFVHCAHWAVSRGSYRKEEDDSRVPIEYKSYDSGVQLLEKDLAPGSIVKLAELAGNAYLKPIENKCQLYGWDVEQFNLVIGTAKERLSAALKS